MQPGSSCGKDAKEITPSLHNAASTFSAGPVTPGDGVGMSDVPQIMRACAASGRLLHPSRPMTAIDAEVVAAVFGAGAGRPQGNVHATYSLVSGAIFDHVMGVDLAAPYAVTSADLAAIRSDIPLRSPGVPLPAPAGLAYGVNADSFDPATLTVATFGPAAPIALAACSFADFQVVHTAPGAFLRGRGTARRRERRLSHFPPFYPPPPPLPPFSLSQWLGAPGRPQQVGACCRGALLRHSGRCRLAVGGGHGAGGRGCARGLLRHCKGRSRYGPVRAARVGHGARRRARGHVPLRLGPFVELFPAPKM